MRIVLREMDKMLELEVVDNGCGIADAELKGGKSLGLLGMRERALAAGGTIAFERHPDHGTIARTRLPLTLPLDPP